MLRFYANRKIPRPVSIGLALAVIGGAGLVAPAAMSKTDSAVYNVAGTASWYGERFHGRVTANGEKYDMYAMTAAHRTLPFGSLVEVTNERNGKSIKLRINDRGPYVGKRIIDVSKSAAKQLGFIDHGLAPVRVKVVGHAGFRRMKY